MLRQPEQDHPRSRLRATFVSGLRAPAPSERGCPAPDASRQEPRKRLPRAWPDHPPRRSALSLPPHTKDASRPSPHAACPVSESERARAGKDEQKRENRLRTPFPPQLVWKGVVGSHKRELDRKVTRRGHFSGTVAYALGWDVGCPCCCCVLPVDYSSWGKDVGKGEPVKTPRWPKIEDLEGAGVGPPCPVSGRGEGPRPVGRGEHAPCPSP